MSVPTVPLVNPPARTPGVEGPPALPKPAAVVYRQPTSHSTPVPTARPTHAGTSSLGNAAPAKVPSDGKAS